ncbi:MAG: hypothetical protein MJZ99_11430 [Bacteroidales bacterium]|nr:hypothetical protein [Bacteroidales bacterium]
MDQTPQEQAYWKRVFPDTNGEPPFIPYAEKSAYPRSGSAARLQYKRLTNPNNTMNFTGYIKSVRFGTTTRQDGTQRETMRLVLKEYNNENGPQTGFAGIVCYVKDDIIPNVKALLEQDPEYKNRYQIKCDGYVSERAGKQNPQEVFPSMYLRAWWVERQ